MLFRSPYDLFCCLCLSILNAVETTICFNIIPPRPQLLLYAIVRSPSSPSARPATLWHADRAWPMPPRRPPGPAHSRPRRNHVHAPRAAGGGTSKHDVRVRLQRVLKSTNSIIEETMQCYTGLSQGITKFIQTITRIIAYHVKYETFNKYDLINGYLFNNEV